MTSGSATWWRAQVCGCKRSGMLLQDRFSKKGGLGFRVRSGTRRYLGFLRTTAQAWEED